MTHASLFSGIGAADRAADKMKWENIFHCEINPFGQKILKYYWPNSISYEDIKKTDFSVHRGQIDVLTGGFPCQPYSLAGQRKGTEDERHLWPEMLRAIREIKPRWIVGENVLGIVSWNDGLVFEEVQTDLEAEGYEVQPYVLPACAVDAPHRRDRVWFVAFNASSKYDGGHNSRESSGEGMDMEWFKLDTSRRIESSNDTEPSGGNVTDSKDNRRQQQPWGSDDRTERGILPSRRFNERSKSFGSSSITSNTDNNGSHGSEDGQGLGTGSNRSEKGKNKAGKSKGCSIAGPTFVTNATSEGLQESRPTRIGKLSAENGERMDNRSEFTSAIITNSDNERIQRGPESGSIGTERQTDKQPDWSVFPTQPPVCSGNDGISTRLDGITFPKWRTESIKAAGNAIVPQVIYQIFKAIEEYEQLTLDT